MKEEQRNKIRDYIAERTFDESGSYSVTPFSVSTHNSLNVKIYNYDALKRRMKRVSHCLLCP